VRIQFRQLLQDIAHQQAEDHAPFGEHQTLEARMHGQVLRQQLPGIGCEFRPQVQRLLQVGAAQRVFFHADEMQAGTGGSLPLEQLPGTEEIQPGTEAGLADAQVLVGLHPGKALRQVVVLKEYVTGFAQPASA
jgi:hypothetical protein